MASYKWPASGSSSGSGVSIYANLAGFPAASSVSNGTLAVAADTNIVYESDGASWSAIASGAAYTNAAGATSLNTISTVVKRDGSGNFAAGTITAALTGNVTGNVTGNLTGTVTGHSTLDLPLTGGTMSGAIAMGGSKVTGLGAPTVNGDALRYDQLGANSGIATLDSGGKVPIAQLPASLMEYQGTWNASTNTPTLADGVGTSGYYYRVQVAGTQNLGSGSLTFVVGDWVMYDGAVWQMAHAGADAVTSVNGSAGVVTVNAINQLTGDVTASAASGSQSKASALVATTNATLATLSALTTAASLASVGTITSGTWSATTIALNKGGTGQTTKTAAYDALNPNTTKGDITARDASNNVRVAVGVNGQVLTADSTQTPGLAWADPSATAGEVNACLNPYATSATTGWAAGTSHSVARDTSNSPLSPAIATCLAITATANAVESSTSGVGYTISTFPAGLRGRKNKVEFWITSPSADTWKVSIYTAGGTRMALSTDSSGATTITAGVTGKFTTTFDADATTTSYIVRFTRTAGTGTTLLYQTNLVMGPGIQPQGAGIGAWQSYTPVVTGVTTSAAAGKYRRIGDSIEISGTFTASGTSTTNVYFPMPSGLTIAAGAGAIGSSLANTGSGTIYKGSSTDYRALSVYPDTTTNLGFVDNDETGGIIDSGDVVSGNVIGFTALVAVNEYAGSGTVNLANSEGGEFAYNTSTTNTAASGTDTTSFGYGPAGANIIAVNSSTFANNSTLFQVRFKTPIQATDQLILEMLEPGTTAWTPTLYPLIDVNGARYGMTIRSIASNATDVNVMFGNAGVSPYGATSYGTAGAAWSGLSTYKWRVRKVSGGGQAVGFAEVVPGTSSGLVSASGLKGNAGTAVATGYVGEKVSASWSLFTTSTTEADVPSASISLGAGTWRLHYSVSTDVATGATASNACHGVLKMTDSANAVIGNSVRALYVKTVAAVANEVVSTLTAEEIVTPTSSTTYKLRAFRVDDVGTGVFVIQANSSNYGGCFYAVRIA